MALYNLLAFDSGICKEKYSKFGEQFWRNCFCIDFMCIRKLFNFIADVYIEWKLLPRVNVNWLPCERMSVIRLVIFAIIHCS